eukprot:TRINITY_DN5107_c0_g2_i1.p1 TRINITY_DN5107_c0_g2~~TRINITY_DN5107_c0_g2_i1.p1  ORF type:complete len:274 (+),score=51.46 TRINITY_DN5107_c0_g2_i1:409-1230(+)
MQILSVGNKRNKRRSHKGNRNAMRQPFGTSVNAQKIRPFICSALNANFRQSAKQQRNQHNLLATNHYGTVVQDNEMLEKLEVRIDELERINEYKDGYIKELEASNSELRSEIAQLKNNNKNMMRLLHRTGEETSEDSNFNTMCVQNMQTEMERLLRTNAEYQFQLHTVHNLNASLKKHMRRNTQARDNRLEDTKRLSRIGDELNTSKSNSGIACIECRHLELQEDEIEGVFAAERKGTQCCEAVVQTVPIHGIRESLQYIQRPANKLHKVRRV